MTRSYRHCSENLELEIDPRPRQLIRNAGHSIIDVARGKHRQHLIAKLFYEFAVAETHLTRRTICKGYGAPHTIDRWARVLPISNRGKRIEPKSRPRQFVRSSESSNARTRDRLGICTRARRDQQHSELARKTVARIGRREPKVLKAVFVLLPDTLLWSGGRNLTGKNRHAE